MTPQEFLIALWGRSPPGVFLIWTLPAKESRWHTHYRNIQRDMTALEGSDIYTGVGIGNRNGGRFTTQKKLTEEEVGGIAGLWADIDWDHPVHRKPNLPPTIEAVLETLEEALLEPTLLVNSGHGIQAWWLFEAPWMFLNVEDHELGRRAAQWWHQHIKGLFTTRGWTTDSVFNLDRIMRLPGTLNHRDARNPKPVAVIENTERRYVPQEFLDLVPEDFRTSTPPPGRNGRRRGGQQKWDHPGGDGGTLVLSSDAEPPVLKLYEMLKANPKFRQSWEQNRTDMTDQSASAYDMSLATMALKAGWHDQEVVDLLICWRRKHGHDLKLRERYYQITVEKAREPMETSRTQERLNEAMMDPPEDLEEVLKDNLSELFRVDIIRIVKYLGDPPVFYIYTKQGEITLGQIGNIVSQEKFRGLVAAATGILIPRTSRKVWDQRVQELLDATEEVEVGDASHPVQETTAWLLEYLLEKPPREGDEWEKAAEAKMPFTREERTHIFADDLRRWLELSSGTMITPHALGRRLRQCKAHTKAVNVKVGQKYTTRTTWILPEQLALTRERNGHRPRPPGGRQGPAPGGAPAGK